MAGTVKVLGVRLAVEGAEKFDKQLNEARAALKLNAAELKKTQAQCKLSGNAVTNLTAVQEELTKGINVEKDRRETLNQVLEETKKRYGENSIQAQKVMTDIAKSEAYEAELEAQLRETNEQLKEQEKSLNNTGKELQQTGEKIEKFGEKTAKVGSKLTTGLTLPIAALGTAAVAAFNEIDDGYDVIIKKTGATGEALNDLNRVAENVYTSMPVNMDDVGNAVGELNTRFDINGDVLEEATKKSLEFARVNDADVTSSIRNVSRYMGDAGIDTTQYGSALDDLTVAGQKTGISIDKLTEYLAKYGAPMRALGFETRESIALFSQWEKSGVNVEIAFSGMKKAISTWAKDGKDSREEFKKTLDEIKACPDIAAATTKAIEVFGTKAGPDLADAIKGGRFEYKELLNVIENSEGTLTSTYESLLDGADKATIATNRGKNALSKLGETVLNSSAPALEKMADGIEKATEWFDGLTDSEKQAVVKTLAFAAAAGPVLTVGGKVVKLGGSVIKGAGKLTSLLSKINPTTATLTIAVGGLAAAYKLVKIHQENFAESASRIPEAMSNFQNMVDSATGSLSMFNIESGLTSEEAENLDNSIAHAQENILKIAENAASESREITDAEAAEINRLIGMIESYTAQKLEAYTAQQSKVRDMIENEASMNKENAAKYTSMAQEAYEQTIAEAEKIRSAAYDKAGGNKELQDAADDAFKASKNAALQEYAGSLSAITESYRQQNVVADESIRNVQVLAEQVTAYQNQLDAIWKKAETEPLTWAEQDKMIGLETELDHKKLELEEAINGLSDDSAEIIGTWLEMAGKVELYGGQAHGAAATFTKGLSLTLNELPDDTKKVFTDAMQGAINGFKDKEPTLYDEARKKGDGVISAMKEALDEHSPSKKTREVFNYAMQGAILGLKDKERELYKKADDIASGVTKRLNKAFEVKSPSRVTRRLFGYVGQGMVLGLKDEEGNIYGTVGRITKKTKAAFTDLITTDWSKYANFGSIAAAQARAIEAMRQYNYNSSYHYSNDDNRQYTEAGIHIGSLVVSGTDGQSLDRQLELIEEKRAAAARARGIR